MIIMSSIILILMIIVIVVVIIIFISNSIITRRLLPSSATEAELSTSGYRLSHQNRCRHRELTGHANSLPSWPLKQTRPETYA